MTSKEIRQVKEQLVNDGYKYIAIAKDTFLSDWGRAKGLNHYQLVVCKDFKECNKVLDYFEKDNSLKYVKNGYVSNLDSILKSKKSFSIRNSFDLAGYYAEKEFLITESGIC